VKPRAHGNCGQPKINKIYGNFKASRGYSNSDATIVVHGVTKPLN